MNTATTPMLKQYQLIKSKHKDSLLFFRLGDFYEMFYDDAKTAAKTLNLVLTSRGSDKSGKIPMCGVPYHAADVYISRLIKAGYKIAICEQVEDPALAKGIVKRQVIRTITAGTFIDEKSNQARYLVCICPCKGSIGIAFTDTTSGSIQSNEYPDIFTAVEIISRLPVYECLYPADSQEQIQGFFKHPLLKIKNVTLSQFQEWSFNPEIARRAIAEHFNTPVLKGFGIEDKPGAIAACGALIEYLKNVHKQPLQHIDKICLYSDTEYMFISPQAVYGLGLDSLLHIIDKTSTAMGKRKLQYWLYHPLKDPAPILQRQQAVKILKQELSIQEKLAGLLKNVPDIDKSLSRISCGYTHARDLLALRNALSLFVGIQDVIKTIAHRNRLFCLVDVPDMRKFLEKTINPDIPLSKPEGKVINTGVDEELDRLKKLQENAKSELREFQARQIEKTGINSLKVGFNKVFGYYIEITKTNLRRVPEDYIRKQTLVNAERFITPELKKFEEDMLSASEKILKIENRIIKDIEKALLDRTAALHMFSDSLARLDALVSLSFVAQNPGYITPAIDKGTQIILKDARHPVVEQSLDTSFIPNDTLLDCEENHLLIITGPNMSGKSTYIRQTAILVILAQIGSFIPASSARIGIVDKVFTRIGAHDEITKAQSTFMVEMSETASILNNLSGHSLVILDEIGRGTSTFDGLSLAWAVGEYLQTKKVRTLFATHFHELTSLAKESKGTKNYNVQVKEWNSEIVFLHKIIPGGTDDSYGIYVAKLAGVPQEVLKRAKQVLTQLEIYGKITEDIRGKSLKETQLSLFADRENAELRKIKEKLNTVDLNVLTPLQAFKMICEWKENL